jgi:pilin isopeptide linkage protein/uncharacterized repeat protein (TIGR02543 family)
MATYYVGSESEFSAAINSGTYPIYIYVTQDFTGNPSYLYSIYGEVHIASNSASPYKITDINIMAGDDSALSLANITLDGTNDAVPAIENYGDLTLDGNTTIRNYDAPAIFNGQPGTVVMNGTLRNNRNPSGNGGGIENYSVVTIDSGVIENNTAQNGGGVWNSSDTASLTLNGGTIRNNTATLGGGVYNDINAALSMTGGTIEENTANNGGGIYSVEDAAALSLTGGTLANNAANILEDSGGNGGGIYLEDGAAASIDGGVWFSGNTAEHDGGAIFTPYNNLPNLFVGQDVAFTTNTAQYKTNILPEDIPLYEAQVLAHMFSDAMPYGYDNYDISYTRALTSITGQKEITGGVMQSFTFNLLDDSGDIIATVQNDGSGVITFPDLLLDGDTSYYNYTLVEDQAPIGGFIPDSNTYPVTVTPGVDASGYLVGMISPDLTVFTNTYNPAPVEALISAVKTASGGELSDGQFIFGLSGDDGSFYEATNDADGIIVFPSIIYSEAGAHSYTISETSTGGDGWTTDTNVYNVDVNIFDDGSGNLTADIIYNTDDGAPPTFENTYQNTPASVSLSATKLAFGKTLSAGDFTFGVFDRSGKLKASATNNADGTIVFPALSFDEPGTYYYSLQETTPSGNGWTTDTRKDPVVITVSDNGQGALVASVQYPFGTAAFRNQYAPSPAVVTPTAAKTASGAALPAGKFTFGLYNHDTGALVDTATNTGSGNITFNNLTFTEPGVYTYQTREITPSTGGWTTDSTVYTAVVTVTDDGAGKLISNIEFTPSEPSFHNSYDPSDTSEDIFGYKVLNNWSGEEVSFDFALTEPDGTVVATTQNSEGLIHFTTSEISSAGTYNYILRETSEDGKGWTTDKNTFAVTVTVVDNGQGKLISTVDYPDGTPTFINTYQTTPASLELTGTKAAVGKELSGNDFIFGVYDEKGLIRSSAYNEADGTITFPAMFFDKAGTMNYTVRELSTDGEGWVTDKNEYPVTIEVVDNGDGTFSISTVRYTRGMPTFTNVYSYSPTAVRLYAAKYATGKAMEGDDFSFAVETKDGEVKAAATNDSHGSVSFPEIQFDRPGVYNYTILETTPPGNGWITDTSLIPVTITVSDNGQGALNAAVSYPDGVPLFYNAYADFTVNFISNGGSAVPDQSVPYGDVVQQPEDPTRPGFSFCGWFEDRALTVPYDFSQPVFSDITLYACWKQESLRVLTAYKRLKCEELSAGQFSFKLYDSSGKLIGTAANDAEGNIFFDSGVFAAGEHEYTLRESISQGTACYHYDLSHKKITVTVSESGEIILDNPPTFVNRFLGCNPDAGGGCCYYNHCYDRCERDKY